MNKFFFLIHILLSFNIAFQIELNENILGTIYDKSIIIIKGMSENELLCYDTLANNKTVILPVVMELITAIKENQGQLPSEDKIFKIISKLGDVGNKLFEYCNLIGLYFFYTNLSDDELRIGIVNNFGVNIGKNADLFLEASTNFVKKRGIDAKLELLGKIIRAITNISFK